jgi:hypothetical protein
MTYESADGDETPSGLCHFQMMAFVPRVAKLNPGLTLANAFSVIDF